jgi:hypothetical protein
MAALVAVIFCLVGMDVTTQYNCQVCYTQRLSNVHLGTDRATIPGREYLPIRESSPVHQVWGLNICWYFVLVSFSF